MKIFLNLIFILLIPNSSFAQMTVEHDWSFERKSWLRYSHSSGGVFGIGKEKKIFDDTTNWSAPLKLIVENNQNISSQAVVMGSGHKNDGLSFVSGCSYPNDFNRFECFLYQRDNQPLTSFNGIGAAIKNLSAFSTRTINRMSEVITSTSDSLVSINVKDYLYSDTKRLRYHSDNIKAKVKINLPHQDEVMVSFVKKRKVDGIFNPQFSTTGAITYGGSNFKADLDLNTKNKWETFWALPGQDNFIEFKIGNSDSGHALGIGIENDEWVDIGGLEIESLPYEKILDKEVLKDFKADNFKDINAVSFHKIYSSKLNELMNVSGDNSVLLRDLLISMVNSSAFKSKALELLSIKELNSLLNSYSLIASKNFLEPKNETQFTYLGWDIKTAAQILSIDLARQSISKLDAYCSNHDIKTSSGDAKNVSGIRLAAFYVGRATSRLKNFSFNDFSYLFEYMRILNNQGLTFAQVRQDQDKINRLRDVVGVLKESNILKKSPFGIAVEELTNIKNNFGDLNSKGVKLSEVLLNLEDINGRMESLRVEVMSKLRTFQSDNDKVVDFSDLESKATALNLEIEILYKNISDLFGVDSTSLASNADDESQKNFIKYLVDVITNYLGVFDQVTGNLSIDKFLLEYKEFYKIDEMREKFKLCLVI